VGKIDTKKMPKTQDELKLALDAAEIKIGDDLAVNQ
jgi:hypothetical protein